MGLEDWFPLNKQVIFRVYVDLLEGNMDETSDGGLFVASTMNSGNHERAWIGWIRSSRFADGNKSTVNHHETRRSNQGAMDIALFLHCWLIES